MEVVLTTTSCKTGFSTEFWDTDVLEAVLLVCVFFACSGPLSPKTLHKKTTPSWPQAANAAPNNRETPKQHKQLTSSWGRGALRTAGARGHAKRAGTTGVETLAVGTLQPDPKLLLSLAWSLSAVSKSGKSHVPVGIWMPCWGLASAMTSNKYTVTPRVFRVALTSSCRR